MTTKVGTRLKCTVSTAEVIVVRAADRPIVITCGGIPMTEETVESDGSLPADAAPVLVGKRYVDADGTVELLCVKGGPGPLAVDGSELVEKQAKPLPSSD